MGRLGHDAAEKMRRITINVQQKLRTLVALQGLLAAIGILCAPTGTLKWAGSPIKAIH